MSLFLPLTLLAFLCHPERIWANRNSLLPVRHDQGHDAELKNSETWYWGHDQGVVGRLTGYFPDEHQKVVNMDRFTSLVRTANCTGTDDLGSLNYVFHEAAYGLVQKDWEWVNENDQHNFILTTVGVQGCPTSGGPTQPFQVKAITWDDASSTATLAVTPQNWTDFLGDNEKHSNTWDLLIDSQGLAVHDALGKGEDMGKAKRGTTTIPIPMAHDFSGPMWSAFTNHANKTTTATLSCSKCLTRGVLDYTITANYDGRQLDGFVQWTPVDLGYTTVWSFDADGNLTAPLPPSASTSAPAQTYSVQLPGGLSIAGVMDLGPMLDFHVNTDMPTLGSGVSATWGFDVALPPGSMLRLPLNYAGNATVRWVPVVTPVPPQARMAAGFALGLDVSPKMAFSLGAHVLGVPFGAGLKFQAPKMQGNFSMAHRDLEPTTTTVTVAEAAVMTPRPTVVAGAADPTITSTGSGPEAFCHDEKAQLAMKMAVDVDMKFLAYAGLNLTKNNTNGNGNGDGDGDGVAVYTSAGPLYRGCLPMSARVDVTVTATALALETGQTGAANRLGNQRLAVAVVSAALIWLMAN